MFLATSLAELIVQAQADRLRVLIVGAGVAGLSLAQSLRADGLHPVLVERADDHADAGYMLALMPLVAPVMRKLGVQRVYRERSARFHRYRLHGRHGQLLREYEIDTLLDRYGDYRGIARGELMQVLADAGVRASYGTTVQALRQAPEAVHATLRAGNDSLEAAFDVVVLADGLHSTTRALLLPAEQVAMYDTHWGGWVTWMDSDAGHADCGDEIWGADFFTGVYPVKGRAGIFLGCHEENRSMGTRAFVAHARCQLRVRDAWLEQALTTVENDPDPYYWKLVDCRCARWAVDRVALLGDAAAGFLPTAGIGAAMAMESAGVLARRLAAVDAAGVAAALAGYERVQRPRVEAAQDNSRQLARLMFHRSHLVAAARDVLARCIPLKTALRPIRRLLETTPQA